MGGFRVVVKGWVSQSGIVGRTYPNSGGTIHMIIGPIWYFITK